MSSALLWSNYNDQSLKNQDMSVLLLKIYFRDFFAQTHYNDPNKFIYIFK
jgi:hypothetical protein